MRSYCIQILWAGLTAVLSICVFASCGDHEAKNHNRRYIGSLTMAIVERSQQDHGVLPMTFDSFFDSGIIPGRSVDYQAIDPISGRSVDWIFHGQGRSIFDEKFLLLEGPADSDGNRLVSFSDNSIEIVNSHTLETLKGEEQRKITDVAE